MLKKTLTICALTISGFMNLQAAESIPPTNSTEMNQQQEQLLACGKKKKNKGKSFSTSSSSELLARGKKKRRHDSSSSTSSSSTLLACGKKKKKTDTENVIACGKRPRNHKEDTTRLACPGKKKDKHIA